MGLCLLTGVAHSQIVEPDLRYSIDLKEVGQVYDELKLFPETVWDTIPPFDFTTLKLSRHGRIPHFLKTNFKPVKHAVEYNIYNGSRFTYEYPPVYSFSLLGVSDGEFYTYIARDVDIPELDIRIERYDEIVERVRDQSFRKTWREEVVASVTSQEQTRTGKRKGLISVDIPLPMPSQLESIFGPGDKTHIDITGREEITFAGESRTIKPYIGVEGKQKQSLFPSLDMEQKLDVSLSGTIGDKLFLQVDHSSSAIFDKDNNIQIYYVGYEDDVIKRVDLGNTNLSLPGSNLISFSGASTGLFGVKVLAEIGSTELTVIASKQEGETSGATFSPAGGGLGQTEERTIRDIDYIKNRYFWFDNPFVVTTLPDNEQSIPIEIWVEIDPSQKNNPDLDWEAGKAFLDLDGRGTNLRNAATEIRRGRKPPLHVAQDFERLKVDVDYRLIFDFDDQAAVVGFELLRSVQDDEAVAVSYVTIVNNDVNPARPDTVGGPYSMWGIPWSGGAERDTMILELVKPKNPRPDNEWSFTWDYMMRNFYSLGLSDIEPNSFELEIRDRTPRLDTSTPTGSTIPYIQIFGLDQFNTAGDPVPDGRFDVLRPEIVNTYTGILQFPSRHPFAPDSVRVAAWTEGGFSFSDSMYAGQWEKSERMYTEYLTNPFADAYQYDIVVRAVSTSKTFRVDALNIIENSEKVMLDGKQLARGTDYSINYDTGEVELKGGALDELTPTSKITIDYEYTPFGGGASSSLVGFSTQSRLGTNTRFGSTLLYESKGTAMDKPRLGEEPTRTLVGGVSGQFQRDSELLTRLANFLPLVDTDAQSKITMSGEVAASLPDPNTKGQAHIEDFEGIEDSDRISMSRRTWFPASVPVDPDDPQQTLPVDSLRTFIWYNIEPNTGGVHRQDLNPELHERENTLVSTLDIEIDPQAAPPDGNQWAGVMTGFGAGGLDLSRGQFLEVWVNDFKQNPADRGGRLRIDMGRIDENFFEPENDEWNDEDQERDGFQSCWDDTGLDGEFNLNPGCVTNNEGIDRDEEGGGAEDVDVNGDDYSPTRIDYRFIKVNGTERNGLYDTEDLDRSGQMERTNSYFSIVVDLSESAVVDIRDAYPTYDGFNNEHHANDSWRLYRIDLADAEIIAPGGVEPRLDEIRHIRVWFDDVQTTFRDEDGVGVRRFQLAEMKIVGNRWQIDGVRDLEDNIKPDSLLCPTSFGIGVISNKTDPGRYNPPFVPPEENDVYEKEQSMFIEFDSLGAQTSVRIFKQYLGRGLDLTSYRDLKFWVHADPAKFSEFNDNLVYYMRLAFNEENYYEISFPVNAKNFDPVSGWAYVIVEMEDITSLKFAMSDTVFDVSGNVTDIIEKGRSYNVRVLQKPNLFDIRYIYAGLRNISSDPDSDPLDGEIWLNDILVGGVRRDMGYAARLSGSVNIGGGVLNIGGSWQRTDADFHGLRAKRGSGVINESYAMNAKTRIEHFIPLFGFSIPLSGNYSKSKSLPRYTPNGDTRIESEVLQDSLRSERVSRSFSTSLVKKRSKNPFLKYTIDKLTTNFAFSENMNRTPTSRDTTRSMNGSVGYQINWAKTREIKLLKGAKFRYWLKSLNFKMVASRRTTRQYRFQNGEFVKKPFIFDADLKMNGSANYSPFKSLTGSFSGALARDLKRSHEVWGFDIGREINRSHNLRVSYKPPPIFILGALSPDVNYSCRYQENSDRNIRRPGDPDGTRNASNQRTTSVKMRLDMGKYFGKVFGKFGMLEEEESKKPARPAVPLPTGASPAGSPAAGDSSAAVQQTVEADTTESTSGADPMIAVRKLGTALKNIRKININVQQRFNSAYTRIPDRPSLLYQFGLTEKSEIESDYGDFEVPDQTSTNLGINLDSGIQLTKDIDIAARYQTTLTDSERQGAGSESTTQTWPDVSLKWTGLERLGLLNSITDFVSANVTYKKQTQESGRKGKIDANKKSMTLSPSMQFTFKNEINSTLAVSYSSNMSDNHGTVIENKSMTVSLDLKKNFRGGSGFKLPIPFFSKEVKWTSTLNSSLRIAYSRASGKRYQTGAELFQPIPMTSSIQISPQATYAFSDTFNGRFFIDFGRSYTEATDQTVTTLRIGISAILTF